MRHNRARTLLSAAALTLATLSVARADCESDMLQLEKAYKVPNLTAPARAALDDAKVKATSAMKKDDDATCHKAIADALPKAGMTLK